MYSVNTPTWLTSFCSLNTQVVECGFDFNDKLGSTYGDLSQYLYSGTEEVTKTMG